MSRRRIQSWLLPALSIVGATLVIYWPALRGGWVWDDQAEVAGNFLLRQPGALFKIWFAPPTADYFPLKTTVQWLGWRLWGAHPVGWHLLNLSLHLFSAFWFWRVLRQLGIRLAWIGGLLFAVHPLAVESVAWIAELKNTLSMAFLLVSAGAYLDFFARLETSEVERDLRPRWQSGQAANFPPGTQARPEVALRLPSAQRVQGARGYYALSILLFAAAVLSKSTVVMLPLALLLHGWWADGRIRRPVLLASIPFFALSLALGLVTVWFQLHRAIIGEQLGIGGPATRLAAAGLATSFYLGKLLLPTGLASIYPRWNLVPPLAWQFLPWLGLAVLAGGYLWTRSSAWSRAVAFALGWFALNLLPVVGLIPMSYLRISWVADHFAYLAMLGPLALVAAGAAPVMDRINRSAPFGRIPLQLLGAVVIATLAIIGRARAGVYQSDEIFWASAQRDNPMAWMPYSNLGLDLVNSGHPAEAVEQFEQGVEVDGNQAELRNNYGKALAALGKTQEALLQFAAALRLKPNFVDARLNFANALAQTGSLTEAASQYRQVLELQPANARAHCYLGFVLTELGNTRDAAAEFQKAIGLDPQYAEPHYRLGGIRANGGQIPAAIQEFKAAIQLDPNYVDALADLGLALTLAHEPQGALIPLRRALALRPDDTAAHAYLGYALAACGQNQQAVLEYRAALGLRPDNADVHYNLGMALRALGRPEEARAELDQAERLQRHP